MYQPEREKYAMLERANEPQLPLWIRIGDWIAVLVLVIAVLFAVTGCATTTQSTAENQTKEVRIVWHRTPHAFADYVRVNGGKMNPYMQGFFVVKDGVCHVYAPDPVLLPNRGYYQGQWGTLGHEVKHCFDGKFHP